jgi:hypothetical protein
MGEIRGGAAFNAVREALLESSMRVEGGFLLGEIAKQDVRIDALEAEVGVLKARVKRLVEQRDALLVRVHRLAAPPLPPVLNAEGLREFIDESRAICDNAVMGPWSVDEESHPVMVNSEGERWPDPDSDDGPTLASWIANFGGHYAPEEKRRVLGNAHFAAYGREAFPKALVIIEQLLNTRTTVAAPAPPGLCHACGLTTLTGICRKCGRIREEHFPPDQDESFPRCYEGGTYEDCNEAAPAPAHPDSVRLVDDLMTAAFAFAEIPTCGWDDRVECEFSWPIRNSWIIRLRETIDSIRLAHKAMAAASIGKSGENTASPDPRPEGVYCHWETYPPTGSLIPNNILVIERVNGDGSVTRFTCAREEAAAITDFLTPTKTGNI